MKKVLVTGAAGSVGLEVIRYLLSEGKYEITALDLKNRRTYLRLKKYKKRINIIYGDVNDRVLIEALVRDHDYIIHLASVLPPFGELSSKIGKIVDYSGTENIIKAINYYNKNCYLLYSSTTSLYSNNEAKVNEEIDKDNLTNFSLNKYNTELLIKKKLKNYIIFRIPLILSNLRKDNFIYNVKNSSEIEVSTTKDVAYAFVKALDFKEKLNKKTFNVGLGSEGRIIYNELLVDILSNFGISFKYILSKIFLEKNYNSPILLDSDELDNIIHYRFDTLYNYNKRLKNSGKKRVVQKLLAKPIIFIKNKK